MGEIWKNIVGYEGHYQISNLGRVRSVDRVVLTPQGSSNLRGRVLLPGLGSHGRQNVSLYIDSTKKTALVHRLVMRAFVGPCPKGMECCHGDGNPLNNCLENLRYDSHKNNQAQRREHGTNFYGEKGFGAKLTNKQVLQVVERYNTGETQTAIAKSLCVTQSTISLIIIGKSWSEITGIQYDKFKPVIPRNRKLTIEQAFDILERYQKGERQINLAREFNVSKSAVFQLINGVTWKHLQR